VPEVKVNDAGPPEAALRMFKRRCSQEGILSEGNKREHFDRPGIRKTNKAGAALKKKLKYLSRAI
jgi:small subunit ribosomal protein S21